MSDEHVVDVTVNDFKHYVRLPVSSCTSDPAFDVVTDGQYSSNAAEKKAAAPNKYVMHIHLREYVNTSSANAQVVHGVAQHLYYHSCALGLQRYEVVIAQAQIDLFLRHAFIRSMVRQGRLRLLIRNPSVPSPLRYVNMHGQLPTSNCYYQGYTQNLALLQHWKSRARLLFFDSDEYLHLSDALPAADLQRLLDSHRSIGFARVMAFCADCDDHVSTGRSAIRARPRLGRQSPHLFPPHAQAETAQVARGPQLGGLRDDPLHLLRATGLAPR